MSDVGVEELADILQKHNDFMAEHYDELIEKYPGKVVAIEDGQVIAVGIDYGEVYRPLLKEERSVMPLVLKVPHPDDLADGGYCLKPTESSPRRFDLQFHAS